MYFHRRAIPLLTTILVLQGVVGAVPHQHGVASDELQALTEEPAYDARHRCLACSVHTPVIEPSFAGHNQPAVQFMEARPADVGVSRRTGPDGAPHPRGPPMGV